MGLSDCESESSGAERASAWNVANSRVVLGLALALNSRAIGSPLVCNVGKVGCLSMITPCLKTLGGAAE